jgi:hypothetical protein
MDTLADILENLFHYIKPTKKANKAPQPLILERLIDGGDEKTKPVYVGVAGREQHQVIRVGQYPEPVHPLKSFVRADDELRYTFEDDIALTLKKSDGGEIAYTLNTPQFTQQSVMRVQYKTLSMRSEELDAIAELK